MSPTFSCTRCGKQYKWEDKLAGKRTKCTQCGTVLQIPASPGTGTRGAPSPQVKNTPGTAGKSVPSRRGSAEASAVPLADRATCPHCNSSCRIRPDWRGRSIQCPKCNKPFTAPLIESRPRVIEPAESIPEFIPDDSGDDSAFEPATDEGTSPYGFVEEETPMAPEVPTSPVPTRKRRKKSRPGGAFGDWVRGQGLWILDAIGVVLIFNVGWASQGPVPSGATSAYKFGLVAGMICAFVIVLPLALAIAAVFFRLACSLAKVETPGFAQCMGIVCLAGCVQGLINKGVGLLVNVDDPQGASVGVFATLMVISLAVGAAVSIAVFMLTLEVSVARAALIWLIEMGLIVVLVIIVVAVVIGIALAFGLRMQPR
jgi:hypothetical protein